MAGSDELIGTVLDGKYKVLRLLGRGGMGEVYAGTHLQLERPVAIKVLHGALVDNESFVARFAREARTAAKLEHPNAVHVYDFGPLADGSAYLVMEFIEGRTLRELIHKNAPFSLHVVLDLMRQAGGAIAAAHARGIVHRDLKPENMMIRADDTGRAVLKVVDFGLAKILENQTSQLTNKSELIGTPRYMAPEQFQDGRVDERADVYALGCVCFELLAGRTPFEGTFLEVVGKHVYAEIPAFEDIGVTVPHAVSVAVRRALAKDPAARTPSVAEFIRELEAACGPDVVALAAEPMTIPLEPPSTVDTDPQRSNFITNVDETSRPEADAYATRVGGAPTSDSIHTLVRDTSDASPTVVRPYAQPTRGVAGAGGARVTARASADDEETPTLPLADVPNRLAPRRIVKPIAVAATIVLAGSATLFAFRPWEATPIQPVSTPVATPAKPAEAPPDGATTMAPAPPTGAPVQPAVTDQPPAPPAPPAKPSAHTGSSSARKDKAAGAEDVAPGTEEPADAVPDVSNIDIPEIAVDPNDPAAMTRAMKKVRRALKQAELERRRAARQRAPTP